MYHTQEKWDTKLTSPIICKRTDAWLGEGYYFWELLLDARIWGDKCKHKTGSYEVYSAQIDLTDVLDTVFNREHYAFWVKEIERVASKLQAIRTGDKKPDLRQVNNFLRQEGVWEKANLTGILFQDNTENPKRIKIENFEYKKRIQLGAFTTKIISDFSFFEEKSVANTPSNYGRPSINIKTH